jgi:hypothetical protein
VRNPSDSWWLKTKRGEERLEELKGLLAPYDRSRPYDVTCEVDPETKHYIYRAWAKESADPWIAVVLGDFLFDLRSALDHMMVALVPEERRCSAYFPIYTKNIWERDEASGAYLKRHKSARKRWHKLTDGLDPMIVQYLYSNQPCNVPHAEHDALSLLARLNNADKHRELTAIAAHFKDPVVTITDGGGTRTLDPIHPDQTLGNGGKICESPLEVEVKAEGALVVGASGGSQWEYGLPVTAEHILAHVGGEVLPALDIFTA